MWGGGENVLPLAILRTTVVGGVQVREEVTKSKTHKYSWKDW